MMNQSTIEIRYTDDVGTSHTMQIKGAVSYRGEKGEVPGGCIYDPHVDSYVRVDGRASCHPELVVVTGCMLESELDALSMMARSTDVTIIGWQGHDIKVIPSLDDSQHNVDSFEPHSRTLFLRYTHPDEFADVAISDSHASSRVHTSPFSMQFN